MSEEFERIKNEVTSFRQVAENKKELERRATEEKIKKDELILEKSGVRQLFEEIRDSRLVEMRPPSKDKVWVNKLFGRGYFEEKLKYYPAEIRLERGRYSGETCYIDKDVLLSLEFNCRPDGDNGNKYNKIQAGVVKGEICLVERPVFLKKLPIP